MFSLRNLCYAFTSLQKVIAHGYTNGRIHYKLHCVAGNVNM